MVQELLLEIKNLEVNFYTYRGVVKALNGVNLKINKGEFFGLVGETGCGKSVTASAVLNLVKNPGKIEKGEIIFQGKDLLKMDKEEIRKNVRGKDITMIMQYPNAALNPVVNNGDQISEALIANKNITEDEAKKRTIELLKDVNIPEPEKIARQYPHQLSGGMAQRVMIAMMLSTKPSLLIADEPTTALDVSIQAQVLSLLKELVAKHKTTILLITHDLSVVAESCDRVGVMYAGDMVETGEVNQIINNPKHPYTKGLINAIPSERSRELIEIKGSVPDLVEPPSGCRFHPRCSCVKPICKKGKPQMREIEKNHFVACFLYEKQGKA
ncbi:MAG: ABC transporter ATP-binding protein [Candidatus Caldatribacteriota bacterium]|nr:ABC transporter ATP-binding protein [Candidatus Caldatribacteriota bacterium]